MELGVLEIGMISVFIGLCVYWIVSEIVYDIKTRRKDNEKD